MNDRLTIEEVDEIVSSARHSQAEENMAALAQQLAEIMRENERLRSALMQASYTVEAFGDRETQKRIEKVLSYVG